MERQVDDIMNEVILSHSPRLTDNPAIKRSISTKKFKNVRVMTDPDDVSPSSKSNSKTNLLIKEILAFMMKHSHSSKGQQKVLAK
jgi:hypothetical protein